MKKHLFPLACMVVGILGSVCEFITSVQDKDLEAKISEEVSKQLAEKDSE